MAKMGGVAVIEDESVVAGTMRAARLHAPTGPEALTLDEVRRPGLDEGEVLVRVHAAGVTRDELEWPVDRLPAIPSYELSGVVASVGAGVGAVAVGDGVYGLTPFDRDGAAAEFVAVPASVLAPKPRSLGHVESAALPLAGLSAWQGLFDHGHLEGGQRVLVHGAAGGVGHLAVQLARWRGAHVIATVSAVHMACAAPPWGRPPAAPCPHAGFDAGLALDGRADARPYPSRRCRCPKRLTMRVAPTFSEQRGPSRLKFDHAQTQL